MINENIAKTIDPEYNTLYPDNSEPENSTMEYSTQLENRIRELTALLACCNWGEYERRTLLKELRELHLTYYELIILITT